MSSAAALRRQVWGEVPLPGEKDGGKCLLARARRSPKGRREASSQAAPRCQGRGHPPGWGLQVVLPEEFLLIAEQLQLLHQVLHHHEHVVGRAGPPLHDRLPGPFAVRPRHRILYTRRRDHCRGGRHRSTDGKSPAWAPAPRFPRPAPPQPGLPRPVTRRPPSSPSPGKLDSASLPLRSLLHVLQPERAFWMTSRKARPFPCLCGGSGWGSPAPRGGVASSGPRGASPPPAAAGKRRRVRWRFCWACPPALRGLGLVRPSGYPGQLSGRLINW